MTAQSLYLFLVFANAVLAVALIAERRTTFFVLAGCLLAGSCSRELTRTWVEEHTYAEAAIYALVIALISITALRVRVRGGSSPLPEPAPPATKSSLASLIMIINLVAVVVGVAAGAVELISYFSS